MKKIFFFLAAMALAITANAKVTTISPDAENDALRLAVHYAEDGDIIEMTEGTYVQCNNGYVEFDGKAVTVRAAEGANVVLQPQVRITIANGGKATFQNIKIDASKIHALADWYEHVFYVADATEGKELVLDGCEFYGFDVNNSAIYAGDDKKLDVCSLNNCYFYNNDKSCLFFEGESLGQLSVTNSTFANITAKVTDSYWAGIIDVRSTAAKVTVDHCTFYNCKLMNTDYAAVTMKGPQAANVVISNNIFMLPEAIDGHRAIRQDVEATNCMTFNYVKDNGGIHSSVTQTNCFLNVDPKFDDAANGNFALAEGSPALGAATDGSNLGDPRWNAPAVEEPEYNVVEDEITNFVFDTEAWPMVCMGGPSTNYQVEVFLVLTEAVDGTLSYEDCSVSIMGTDATFIDGTLSNIDPSAPYADAVLHVQWDGDYYELQLAMSSTPAEPITIEAEDATVTLTEYPTNLEGTEFAYELAMVAEWVNEAESLPYTVEFVIPTFDPTKASGEYNANFYVTGEGAAFGMNEGVLVTVTKDGNNVTLTGNVSALNSNAYNVTISGTLPEVPTALDNVDTTVAPAKAIVNGQLVIIKNDVQYNAQGAIVK